VVPRNLRKLALSSVECIQLLQDLTALETLELWSAEIMAPEVLRQISDLSRITELQLGYFPRTPERLEEHSGVWPALKALKALDINWHIWDENLPARIVTQLPHCSGLTRLSIEVDDEALIEGTAEQFAAAVSQLKQLQELRFAGEGVAFEERTPVAVFGAVPTILLNLLKLQDLRSLALLRVDLEFADAVGIVDLRMLTLLTQLTKLELECVHHSASIVRDSCLCDALWHVACMSQLQSLRLAVPKFECTKWAPYPQLMQLQQIEYHTEGQDLKAVRQLWSHRPGVRVMSIQPDGSTVHMCGGKGML
jgi:hypothetical protein